MMELNKLTSIKNVLVITDHFMHYALAYIMRDQTAKTMAKVLYEWFITVFGTPAKLLSDHSTNFTLALVKECIWHPEMLNHHLSCNGQMERFYQTLFKMIGKLAADKKAQWEQHLPELLQVYNSTWSVVTSYSPHYLMFGRHPCLPVDFYFLTMGTHLCPC